MYYPYFVTYILAGFSISLVVFLWALKTGQFSDQRRARYLPLAGEPEPPPARPSRFYRLEIYGLWFLIFAGLLATGAVLVFSLVF